MYSGWCLGSLLLGSQENDMSLQHNYYKIVYAITPHVWENSDKIFSFGSLKLVHITKMKFAVIIL